MGCSIHSSVVVHLWVNLLASQTWAQFLCSPLQSNEYPAYPEEIDFENDTHDSCFNYTLVHFPNELTEVRWDSRKYFPDMNMTMFYKLNDLKWKQCPQYILDQGYNTGCVFQAEKDAHLHISIRDTNGTKDLYFDEQHIFKFLKPDPPENVTIQWMDGEVIAQCMPSQPPQNFELEFQYKSRFDKDWQSRKNDCCKIKDQGFDLEKCYTFRFRLKNIYGDYSSEWTAETLWTNGSSVDSCATEISEPEFSTIILLTSVMAGVLIIFVLLLCLCRLDRTGLAKLRIYWLKQSWNVLKKSVSPRRRGKVSKKTRQKHSFLRKLIRAAICLKESDAGRNFTINICSMAGDGNHSGLFLPITGN